MRGDASIAHEARIVEAVVRKTAGPVHLVGHSFGALVGLAVALRGQVTLNSLAIVEAPAVELLRERRCAARDAGRGRDVAGPNRTTREEIHQCSLANTSDDSLFPAAKAAKYASVIARKAR